MAKGHVRNGRPTRVRTELDRLTASILRHSGISKELRRYVFLNCWHMNKGESAAMWSLCLKSNEGVAIRSTYSKLKECFTSTQTVWLGAVTYKDYEKDKLKVSQPLTPFFHKRRSFEHEKEVRAIIDFIPSEGLTSEALRKNSTVSGMTERVDLTKLIDAIYVAPTAPKWVADLVKATVKRFGFSFDVKHSDMNNPPLI